MKLKFNLFRKAVLAVLSVSLFVSCQDTWNNHYSTDTSVTVDMTIAEFLDQDPTLSNFVKVLKTTPVFTGKKATKQSYYEFLKEKQFVTLWVPSNESLSKEEWDVYMKEDKSTDEAYHVQLEFIKNHMALANPTAAITGKKKVTMMSKKYFMVGPDNIDGVEYIPGKCNIACNNGILHKLNGQALKYKKSLYEILTTEPQFSLIGMFLDSYYETELDESQSVSAGIDEYGDIVYADSVLKERNPFLQGSSRFKGFGDLLQEDSTYLVVAANDQAWGPALKNAMKYFNFGTLDRQRKIAIAQSQVEKLEPIYGADAFTTIGSRTYLLVDSLQWLYAHAALFCDMVFNTNPSAQYSIKDSVWSTSKSKPAYASAVETPLFRTWLVENQQYAHHYYNPYGAKQEPIRNGGIFNASDIRLEGSNGEVLETNEMIFDPYSTYNLPIVIAPEKDEDYLSVVYETLDKPGSPDAAVGELENVTWILDYEEPLDSTIARKYLRIMGSNGTSISMTSSWSADFKLYNILSGKYALYMVTLCEGFSPDINEYGISIVNSRPTAFWASTTYKVVKSDGSIKDTTKYSFRTPKGKKTNVFKDGILANLNENYDPDYKYGLDGYDLSKLQCKICDTILLDTVTFQISSFDKANHISEMDPTATVHINLGTLNMKDGFSNVLLVDCFYLEPIKEDY